MFLMMGLSVWYDSLLSKVLFLTLSILGSLSLLWLRRYLDRGTSIMFLIAFLFGMALILINLSLFPSR